jgi:hypothetical protein
MRDGCRDAHIQSLREGLKAIKSKTGNQDGKSLEKLESYIQEILRVCRSPLPPIIIGGEGFCTGLGLQYAFLI